MYYIYTKTSTFETDMYEEGQYGIKFWPYRTHPAEQPREVFVPWQNLDSVEKIEKTA